MVVWEAVLGFPADGALAPAVIYFRPFRETLKLGACADGGARLAMSRASGLKFATVATKARGHLCRGLKHREKSRWVRCCRLQVLESMARSCGCGCDAIHWNAAGRRFQRQQVPDSGWTTCAVEPRQLYMCQPGDCTVQGRRKPAVPVESDTGPIRDECGAIRVSSDSTIITVVLMIDSSSTADRAQKRVCLASFVPCQLIACTVHQRTMRHCQGPLVGRGTEDALNAALRSPLLGARPGGPGSDRWLLSNATPLLSISHEIPKVHANPRISVGRLAYTWPPPQDTHTS
jgi:hypothetical protein